MYILAFLPAFRVCFFFVSFSSWFSTVSQFGIPNSSQLARSNPWVFEVVHLECWYLSHVTSFKIFHNSPISTKLFKLDQLKVSRFKMCVILYIIQSIHIDFTVNLNVTVDSFILKMVQNSKHSIFPSNKVFLKQSINFKQWFKLFIRYFLNIKIKIIWVQE